MVDNLVDRYQKMLDELEEQNKSNMDRLRSSLGAVIPPQTPEDKLSAILEKVTAIEAKVEKTSAAYAGVCDQMALKLDKLYKELVG